MVGSDGEDVRGQRFEASDESVDFFNGLDFGFEVSVFAGGVSFFEMDIKEVVLVIAGFEGVEEICRFWAYVKDLHANEPGQAAIHRVIGAGSRLELIEPVSYTHLTLPTNREV